MSSLSILTTLPIDTKVDQSFVARLAGDPAAQTILTAIIQPAHGLGMTVISEGVETATQRRKLAALGSDSCQGYFFAHPMPARSLDALLHDDRYGRQARLPPDPP